MASLADLFSSQPQQGVSLADLTSTNPYSGMLEPGNINLTNRPQVKNPDGTISTIRSMDVYVGPDGKAMIGGPEPGNRVLLPTVSDDGRIMSDQEAVDQYNSTGRHLGKFTSSERAGSFAQHLHEDQDRMYPNPGPRP